MQGFNSNRTSCIERITVPSIQTKAMNACAAELLCRTSSLLTTNRQGKVTASAFTLLYNQSVVGLMFELHVS